MDTRNRIRTLLTLAPTSANADDWPGWLGARRDGVWAEKGIVDSFGAGGPKVVWRKNIGTGFSGPAVAHGRVYVADRLAEGIRQQTNLCPQRQRNRLCVTGDQQNQHKTKAEGITYRLCVLHLSLSIFQI